MAEAHCSCSDTGILENIRIELSDRGIRLGTAVMEMEAGGGMNRDNETTLDPVTDRGTRSVCTKHRSKSQYGE